MMQEKDHGLKDTRAARRIRPYVLSLVAVLVAAGTVPLAVAVHRARKQALAVDRLQAAGLTAYYDYQRTEFGLPDRSGSAVMPGPRWLKHLFGVDLFHNVTAVSGPSPPDWACERIADSALAPVEQLPEVTWVSLKACDNITDAAVPHLLSLKKITHLELDGTRISDVGVTALRGMTALRWLDLSFTSTTDAGVRAISELPNLECLHLADTRITDAGLRALCDCQSLQSLTLEFCAVTSAGLAQLECLGGLEELWLGGIPLRDADADNLGRLKSLRLIFFGGCEFTEHGEKRLRELIPGLESVLLDPHRGGGGLGSDIEGVLPDDSRMGGGFFHIEEEPEKERDHHWKE